MRKFRVKAGTHFEGGTTYKKGDVVTSSLKLAELFREKFEDLGPATPPATAEKPSKKKELKKGDEGWEGDKNA